MVYKGLLIEFSDGHLSEMDIFEDIDESAMQSLADCINATYQMYMEDMSKERMWNTFIHLLIKISNRYPDIELDVCKLKRHFVGFYEKMQDSLRDVHYHYDNEELIATEFIECLLANKFEDDVD